MQRACGAVLWSRRSRRSGGGVACAGRAGGAAGRGRGVGRAFGLELELRAGIDLGGAGGRSEGEERTSGGAWTWSVLMALVRNMV